MVSAARVMTSVEVSSRPKVTRRRRGPEPGRRRSGRRRSRPARCPGQRRGDDLERIGDRVDLPVAVELVAEQVGDRHRPRPDLRRDQRQRTSSISLTITTGSTAGRAGRTRRPPVRSRPGPGWRQPGCGPPAGPPAEQRRHEPGGRRLPVAAGDRHHRDPLLGDQRAEDARVHAAGDHARQRGSASAPRSASRPRRPCRRPARRSGGR